MTQDHNQVANVPWEDEWGPMLDQAYQETSRILSETWEQTKVWSQEALDTVSQWVNQITG